MTVVAGVAFHHNLSLGIGSTNFGMLKVFGLCVLSVD